MYRSAKDKPLKNFHSNPLYMSCLISPVYYAMPYIFFINSDTLQVVL